MKNITASDLGIDVRGASGLYKWLVASFLMGKRIRSTVAVKAYRIMIEQEGLETPSKLAQASHSTLVRLLGQAGYARYDESTARRLHALGNKLEAELGAQLEALPEGVESLEAFSNWLLSFEGVGPKTLEIFLREASAHLHSSKGL